MSETLHKLQVVIEGNSSKLTQATREAMQETRRMTSGINAELKKISSHFAGMKSNPAREITRGIRDMMKQMQIAAGMKVYTDDYKKVCKDISDTEKELDKLRGKMSGMEGKEFVPTQEFKDLEKNIQKSSSALEKLNSQKVKMEQAGKDTVPTEDYTAVTNQMSDAQNRLSSLKTQMEEWKGLGVNSGVGMEGLRANIAETEKEISYLKGELKDLQDTGGASRQTDAYRDLTGEITRTEKKLQEYKDLRSSMLLDGSNLEESEAFRKNELAIQDATKRLREYNAEKSNMEKSGSDVKLSGKWKNAATGILSKSFAGMKSTLGQVTAGIKTAGGAFASLIQRFRNGIPAFSRTKNAAGGLGGAFKTLGITAKFMLASFLISNSVRGAADGFKNLAKYSSSTNAELSSLMNSLNLLKNSLASAFSPVLSAIAPALDTLINYCVNAINAIGQLFAALTGQGTYYKAVKGNQDFAAGLSKSADKANNSAKALKNTLMGFDEINKLDDDSGSGGSGGSGGGGSAGSFDMVPVENAYADFAKQIKDAWAKADFTELGGIFGTKIRDALNSIPWDEIKETAQKVGKSLATFINGAVEVSGLADAVGNTVAQALNTGVAGADSFMKNLHWDSVGQFVADSMNGFVKKADWKGIGTAVKDGINGVMEAKATWAGTFDFKAAGEAVKTALNTALSGINWSTAITAASNVGSGIAESIRSLMTEDTFENVGTAVAGALNTVFSGTESLLSGIDFKKLADNLASGINKAVKDTNFETIGNAIGDLIQGALDFATTMFDKLSWTNIKTALQNLFKGIAEKVDLAEAGKVLAGALGAWLALNLVTTIGATVLSSIGSALISGIASAAAAAVAAVGLGGVALAVGAALAAIFVVPKVAEWLKDVDWEGIGNKISELFAAGIGKIEATVKAGVELVKQGWTNVKTWLSERGEDIKGTIDAGVKLVKNGWKNVSSWLSGLGEAAKGSINAGVNLVKQNWTKLSNWLSGLNKDDVEAYISAGVKLVKQGWTTVSGWLGDVKDAVLNVKAAIKTKASDLWKSLEQEWGDTKAFQIAAKIKDKAEDLWTTYENAWKIGAKKLLEIGVKLLTDPAGLWKDFKKAWGDAKDKSVQVGIELVDGIKDWWNGVENWLTEKFGWLSKLFGGGKESGKTTESGSASGGTFGGGGKEITVGVKTEIITKPEELRASVQNDWNSLGTTTVGLGTSLLDGSTSKFKSSVQNNWNTSGGTSVSVGTKVKDGSTKDFRAAVAANWLKYQTLTVGVGTHLKSGASGNLRSSILKGWGGLKTKASVGVGTFLRGGSSRDLRNSVLSGWNNLGGVSVSTGVGIRDSSNDLWNKVQNLWNNYGAKQTLWFKINPTAASWTPGRKATGGLYTSGQWRPITAAASGGAFSTGQMFIAREAGPELVGSIGRSTAVMNNTQIVSSVAAGVYSAVVSAFSQYAAMQNSQSGTANINVYVGGKQVTDVVIEEVNRRTSANGVCPIRT